MGNTEIASKELKEKYSHKTTTGAYKYITPITEKPEGETSIYRNPASKDQLVTSWNNLFTLKDILLFFANQFPNKEYLGSYNAQDNQFHYKNFQQCLEEMKYVGSALINLDLFKADPKEALRLIGVFSQTREEFQILDQACALYDMQVVAIYETLQNMGIEHILKETEIKVLFCSAKQLNNVAGLSNLYNLETIVMFDKNVQIPDNLSKLKIMYWDELLKVGKEKILEFADITPETMYTICYTSGTTGTPKGALINHKNMVAAISHVKTLEYDFFFKDGKGIYFAFLPLAHSFGRMVQWLSTYFQCKIAFFTGNIKTLKNEMQLVKPTFIIGVPRIFSKICEAIQSKLDEKTGLTKMLINRGVSQKKKQLYNNTTYSDWLYDRLIFNKCKEAFGGNLKAVLNGSAPLSTEQQEFLKIALCCPIYNAYGATENTAGAILTSCLDVSSGTVGGPTTGCEVKLVDVPEMNYTSNDKDEFGNPSPRGELFVRGDIVIKGYYKNQEETDKILDKDGWLHSGDIAQIKFNQYVDGGIYIIDRKKNIFKLSQGEYVAPEKLEVIYGRNKYIQDIFIYGNSFERFIVAIIVPDQVNLQQYAKDNNISGTFEELCKNKQIIELIFKQLESDAKENGFIGYEYVKKLHLHSKLFQDEEILTPSMKLQRHNAKVKFETIINQLYEEIKNDPNLQK